MSLKVIASALLGTAFAAAAIAAPVTYNVDPGHTYPSFEADHMGGLSIWRGKFNTSSGTVTLDKEAQTGTVAIKIETASIDFGHDEMNAHARGADMFDVEKYPTAIYTGKLTSFVNGAPTEVDGTLELRGVSKPVKLRINQFTCKPHPMLKKEVCGADASGEFQRDEFGIDYGKNYGFNMNVKLAIQIEAVKAD
jgi:polyisoprenoid-binding protein YceI